VLHFSHETVTFLPNDTTLDDFIYPGSPASGDVLLAQAPKSYIGGFVRVAREHDGVELIGIDLNPVLVVEAARLAMAEKLDCRFEHGDGLADGVAVNDGARTVVISTGLLHHLPGPDLPEFFATQARLGVAAFAHWDIVPCAWSTLGAWVFHQARMRERVSRHDGVMSARRSHRAGVLLAAARSGAPGYQVAVLETKWHPRSLDVLRPVLGVRT